MLDAIRMWVDAGSAAPCCRESPPGPWRPIRPRARNCSGSFASAPVGAITKASFASVRPTSADPYAWSNGAWCACRLRPPTAPHRAERTLFDDGLPLAPLPKLPAFVEQIPDLHLSLIGGAPYPHPLVWNRLDQPPQHPLKGSSPGGVSVALSSCGRLGAGLGYRFWPAFF